MPRCELCDHWKPQWAPYIKKQIMDCELPTRNPSCKGDFKAKEGSKRLKGKQR